jgi:hypothetical protein
LELRATTHWAAIRDQAGDVEEATDAVRAWSPRKERLFTREHVELAWAQLDEGGRLAPVRETVPA